MILKVISSGSSGNAYILDSGKEQLLLECGVKWSNIVKALGYTISNAVGILVSHRHLDHAKSISNALTYRIPVYSCKDVCERHKGVILIEPNKKYRIGDFVVQPIPVKHNVECYAYLIEHEEMGRLLFATDLCEFPYKIKNINHLAIESNFDEDILINCLCENQNIRSNNQYHMEISETIKVIKGLYSGNLNTVLLCHLSDRLSNERNFQQRVFNEVGIYPKVATKQTVLELSKDEF